MSAHRLIPLAALNLLHRFDLLAALLRFIVLLPILVQAPMAFDGRLLRARFHAGVSLAQRFDEAAVSFFTMLAFGVTLRSRIALLSIAHEVSTSSESVSLQVCRGAIAGPAASACAEG